MFQRTASLYFKEAMSTMPTYAHETNLHFIPLDVLGKQMTARAVVCVKSLQIVLANRQAILEFL